MDLSRSLHYYGQFRSFTVSTLKTLLAQNWPKLAKIHRNWDLENQDLDLQTPQQVHRLYRLIGYDDNIYNYLFIIHYVIHTSLGVHFVYNYYILLLHPPLTWGHWFSLSRVTGFR